MNKVPENLAKSSPQEASLFEVLQTQTDGWRSEDLNLVKSCAEAVKSKKMVARIRAVAKMAVISKKFAARPQSFAELLFTLNSSNKLIRENLNYIVVELAANFRFPKLPLGYGFKGGAARIALSHVIGQNTKGLTARDYDVVRFSKGSLKQDQSVAAKVMQEDFSHGYGVEVVSSLDRYFKSRDLTINEVLLAGKKVIFTREAFEDMRNGVLRVGGAYSGMRSKIALPGKIACKILRLAAELEVAGKRYQLVDFPFGLKVSAGEFERQRSRAAELGNIIETKYSELCAKNLKFEPRALCSSRALKPNRQACLPLRLRSELQRHRKHF